MPTHARTFVNTLRLNRTRVELKLLSARSLRDGNAGLNRTRVELKHKGSCLARYWVNRFESHQSGIETLNLLFLFSFRAGFESHQSGIETC